MSFVREIISFFQSYPTQSQSTPQKRPLLVQYHLELTPSPDQEIDHWLSVRMKIGERRLYTVKSIRKFLKAYQQHQTMEFTKNFVYDPEQYGVTREDQLVFQFLLEQIESERMYRYLLDPWSSQHIQERSLFIPPHRVGKFLKSLPRDRTILQVDQQKNRLGIVKKKCPIIFSFTQEKGQYVLKSLVDKELSDPSQPFLLSKDGYCYANGNIYQLNEVQRKFILPLHQNIQSHVPPQLLIPSHLIEQVASVVLPILQTETQLRIDDVITQKMVRDPLEVKIYLDRQCARNQERLTAKMVYVYGEYKVNPFQEEDENGAKILVRQIQAEQEIMSFFEQSSFKYNGHELYLEEEEEIFFFLHKQVPRLKEMAKIDMSASVEKLLLSSENQLVPKMDLDPSYHWLEVRFEIPNVEEEELQSLIQAMIDKKTYYRFRSGVFVPLDSQWIQLLRALQREKALKMEGTQLKIPALRALQVETEIEENEVNPWKKGQRFRQMLQKIKHPEKLNLDPPASVRPVLRDYQRLGFQWLKTLSSYRFGGILADDMGLGKTIQVIALIISQLEEQNRTPMTNRKEVPALVVVPTSLIYNWQQECARFAPQLKTVLINGDKEERRKLFKDPPEMDVMITTYPLLKRDIDWYKEYFFQTLILDEAQYFKNRRTQTAQAVKKIQASTCFALTGTPIENHLEELFSICDIVLPGLFANQKAFRKCSPQQIAQRVKPFILRRLKQDVLAELPDKIETIKLIDLTTEQKKVYLAFLKKLQDDAKQWLEMGDFQKHRMQILAGLTRLRQICCHPSLFLKEYPHDSGKFTYLLELLEDRLQHQHRILVFSQFTSMLSLIAKEFTRRGQSYYYLDGEVPSPKRLEMVERFNRGEKDLFLISLKAGGTGLNLTGADTVIFYDLWWNPAVEQQATDRAYRMGQTKKVQVIRLISQGTIEEKIYELHQQKQKLVEQVIQPGEHSFPSLNEEEIREILGV